jgi:hypothetical protein
MSICEKDLTLTYISVNITPKGVRMENPPHLSLDHIRIFKFIITFAYTFTMDKALG